MNTQTYNKLRTLINKSCPATLQDVLMAIHSRNDMNFDEGYFYFNHGSITFKFRKDTIKVTGTFNYNLSLPLKEQSQETGEFIINLIQS